MKKIFVAVVGLIVVGVVGVMAVQREQITRLQKEMNWLKRDVHSLLQEELQEELKEVREDIRSLRSQTVALDRKVFRDFACFMAGGKLGRNSEIFGGCTIIEEKAENFNRSEKLKNMEQAGWQLGGLKAGGPGAEQEGKKLLNLLKKNKIRGAKEMKVRIFNSNFPSPSVEIFWFYLYSKK